MIRYAAWDPARDLMRVTSLYAPTVGRDLLYTSLDDLFDHCIYSFIRYFASEPLSTYGQSVAYVFVLV